MIPPATWWARCRAWEASPILVKEARQSVRSLSLPAVLCLLLVVLAGSSLLRLVPLLATAGEKLRAGPGFFMSSLFILMLAEGAAALVLFQRTLEERAPHRRDLLYITTLRPPQIVRGKFVAAMTFSLVLLGAGLPFVVLSYFLRGIGLPAMGGGLLMLLLLTALWNLWAIAIGVAPTHALVKWLLWAAGMALTGFCALGAGIQLNMRYNAALFVSLLVILIALGWLLYAIAVFLLQPPNSNRSLPLRFHALAILLILAASGCSAVQVTGNRHLADVVMMVGFFLAAVLFVLAFHAGDAVPGERWRPILRRGRGLLRRLPFLLGETTLSGLLFALLYGLLCSLLSVVMDAPIKDDLLMFAYPYLGYLLAYALIARWLTALLQKKFPQVAGAWVFLILTAAVSLVSGMVWLILDNQSHWAAVALGCILAGLLEGSDLKHDAHILTLAALLALALRGNGQWLVDSLRRSARNGQPPVPPPLPTDGEPLPP